MSESDAQNSINAGAPRLGEIGRAVARNIRGLVAQTGLPSFASTLADATQARGASASSAPPAITTIRPGGRSFSAPAAGGTPDQTIVPVAVPPPAASPQPAAMPTASTSSGVSSVGEAAPDGQVMLMAAAQATPTTGSPAVPPGYPGAPGYPATPAVTGSGTRKDPLILPYGATQADIDAAAAATAAARASEIKPLGLKEYPRPEYSDRNGVLSWSSSTPPPGRDLDRFVSEARHRQAGWVTFEVDPGDVPQYDELIERLTEAGIQPVARIQDPYGDLPPEEVKAIVKDLTAQGVRYFQLFDGPNVKANNPGDRVSVRDYAERWLAAARAVVEGGGLPGIGALAPNGDYDDRGFMRQLLSRVKDRGGEDVLGQSWLALRAEQPGAMAGPSDVQNLAERAEWFDRVSRQSLGRSLPIMATLDPAGRAERLGADPVAANASAAEQSERTIADLRRKAPFLFGVNRGTVESARP